MLHLSVETLLDSTQTHTRVGRKRLKKIPHSISFLPLANAMDSNPVKTTKALLILQNLLTYLPELRSKGIS